MNNKILMKKIFGILIIAVAAVLIFSCKDDNSLEKLRQNELVKLDAFIEEHYHDSVPKPSGLYYFEDFQGFGDSLIQPGDRVQIFYATWTIDSVLIDESDYPGGYTKGYKFEPLEFIVGAGGVIAGLEEAAIYMRQGTVANLVIPSELAYGQNGSYGTVLVPGFTSLLMQVEVYKIFRPNQ
jgi:FKBP-type peptidyl-prolyl cis-trans isomerase